MVGDGYTPGKYTAKAQGALHANKKKGLRIVDVVVLTLSFAAGILIVTGLLNLGSESSDFAREVGEPEASFSAEDSVEADVEVGVEVAGVVCDVTQLSEDATSFDVLELWNSAIISEGDACTAPFADSLGPAWEMTDAELSIFGPIGSLYEFSNGSVVEGLRISFTVEDTLNDEPNAIGSLIDTIWGPETVDWANGCDVSPSTWSGSSAADGLTIELTRCR